MTYQPKTYRKQGGDEFVIADGGKITVESVGEIQLDAGAVFDDSRWPATIAVAGATLPIPVTHMYVAKTTGGAEALTLADGVDGQIITISLVSDGGDGTLTPATSSGWATVVFADVGDTLTVRFIDDTVGWVIMGAAGVLAPPVISL